jgi:hypothetical protein
LFLSAHWPFPLLGPSMISLTFASDVAGIYSSSAGLFASSIDTAVVVITAAESSETVRDDVEKV